MLHSQIHTWGAPIPNGGGGGAPGPPNIGGGGGIPGPPNIGGGGGIPPLPGIIGGGGGIDPLPKIIFYNVYIINTKWKCMFLILKKKLPGIGGGMGAPLIGGGIGPPIKN